MGAGPSLSPGVRRRRAPGLLRVLARLLVGCLVLALGGACAREVDIAPPRADLPADTDHSGSAQRALDGLVGALEAGSTAAVGPLAGPGARPLLTHVVENGRALRLEDVSLRYVDDAGPPAESEQARLGADAWQGTVTVTYRLGGFDTAIARTDTTVIFVPGTGGAARVAGFGGDDVRTPLWLEDRLSVVRTGRTLLMVAGRGAGRYPRLVERAVRQVRRTLPTWDGPLVVEVPRTRAQLDDALDSHGSEYDNIAAVTTTADGTVTPGAPVRVFVNPEVFDGLQERGAQVVMSHETTHVATGATNVTMPTWLLEGFADFVALRGTGIPVRTAAAQILKRVRDDGPPDGLPTSEDLDPTADGLGATYEEAWLACRFLAQEEGAAQLVRFYDAVSGGAGTEQSFRDVLGTTQRRFVARWRADTAAVARVAR